MDKPSTITKIKVILPTNNDTYNNWNCRKANKKNCPLQINCLIKNVAYKVNVIIVATKGYIGLTGRHFKDRYTGHKYTLNHIDKNNSSRLCNFVWKYFSRYGKKPDRKWSIVHHVKGNIGGARKICQLCNLERLAIVAEDKHQLLTEYKTLSTIVHTLTGSSSIKALITSHIYSLYIQTNTNILSIIKYYSS